MTLSTPAGAAAPVITIGLPVWNGGQYLAGALDGLLGQTYADFELILSDNGSDDGTEAIAREYAARDSRIVYVRHKENMGPHANFNFLLSQVKTEFFMFAACDDRWDSNFVEVLLNTVRSCDDCIGAQGDVVFIGEDGANISDPMVFSEMERPTRLRRISGIAGRDYIGMYYYGVLRTDPVREIGVHPFPLAERYTRNVEYPILYFLACRGRIVTNCDTRFHYRVHPNQDSNRSYPFLTAIRLELGLLLATPLAVWKGARSPGLAMAACACMFRRRAPFLISRLFQAPVRLLTGRRAAPDPRGGYGND